MPNIELRTLYTLCFLNFTAFEKGAIIILILHVKKQAHRIEAIYPNIKPTLELRSV